MQTSGQARIKYPEPETQLQIQLQVQVQVQASSRINKLKLKMFQCTNAPELEFEAQLISLFQRVCIKIMRMRSAAERRICQRWRRWWRPIVSPVDWSSCPRASSGCCPYGVHHVLVVQCQSLDITAADLAGD